MAKLAKIDTGSASEFEFLFTGLPILKKPEWTNVCFGKDYRISISIIGDNIVWLQPSGYANLPDVVNALRFTKRVRNEAIPKNSQYVQIDDWTNLTGSSFRARKYYIDNLKRRERLRGLILYNASPMLKMSINLGKRLNILKFDAEAIDDYPKAIKLAQKLLCSTQTKNDESFPDTASCSQTSYFKNESKIFANLDWTIRDEHFLLRFELLYDDILHGISTGRLQKEHIEPAFRMKENIINSMNLLSNSYYYVLGLNGAEGISQRARKLYINAILEHYKKYPFKMFIFYGVNKLLTAAINLAKPFVPFKVQVVKDLEEALKLVAKKKSEQITKSDSVPAKDLSEKTDKPDEIQRYVDEVLQFLEQINWEVDGIKETEKRDLSHPFNPVFDAVELIKWELDDLYQKRKEAEEAFRRSEEKFRQIVESSPMGIHMYKLEPNGQLIFNGSNPAADTILGVDNKQFIDKTIEEAFPPLTNTEIPSRYRRVCKAQENWEAEQIVYKDEQIQGVFEVHAFQTGKDTMAAMFFDITAKKLAEKALLQSEEKYKTLTNNLNVGIYRINVGPEGRFLEANPAIVKMFGFQNREEFLSVRVADLYQNPEDRKKFNEKLLRNGRLINEELHLKKRDGTPIIGSLSTVAVKNKKGKVKYYDGIIEDISERKQLETQLQIAQRMEAIGTLAGGIAHDFNNILSAIVGYTELALGKTSEDDPRHVDLQEVFRAGMRARDLVKQILTFSRQAEQNLQPVQVNLIVKEALKFLRSSLPSSIKIRPNIVSDVRVLADPTQIHQVLMNLCANAKHAMLETGGVLEVSLTDVELKADSAIPHPEVAACPYLKLTVTDDGEGMSAEVREKIFDPFFTTKGKEEGTGLGLAVVHGIVKSCGGFITVSSEEGKGSIFNVFLPVIDSQAKPQTKFKGPLPSGSERVLFVDDEKLLVDIGKQMLERYGYRVTPRTSSVEALELFKAKPDEFDLVITDMTMPNMNGLELASEMIKLRPELPIILCTGFSETTTQAGAEAAGIKAFMLKPISRNDLICIARKVLDESK